MVIWSILGKVLRVSHIVCFAPYRHEHEISATGKILIYLD